MFAVVEFMGANDGTCGEISIVPLIWLIKNEKKCYWPKRIQKNCTFEEFVKNQTPFKKSWSVHKVYKVHLKTDSYDRADKAIDDILQDALKENDCSNSSTRSLNRKLFSLQNDEDSSSDSIDDSPPNKKLHYITAAKSTPSSLVQPSSDVSIHSSGSNTTSSGLGQVPRSDFVHSPSPSLTRQQQSVSPISSVGSTSFSVVSHSRSASFIANPDFEKTVLGCLTKLNENVDQHSMILNELLRNSRKSNESSVIPPEGEIMPTFPLNSLLDFQTFDERLLPDAALTKYMILRLSAVGGSGIENQTRRILKYILTNEVACHFNWKGRDKLSFENTRIMSVIYDAAKRNYPPSERNDLLIANAVKDWLKYGKARLNYKRKN